MHATEKDNIAVWDGKTRGWYEVWYFKWNDAGSGAAVWLRYTILIPLEGRGEPVGELWAIVFDRRNPGANCAFKRTLPMADVVLDRNAFGITIDDSVLTHTAARGHIGDGHGEGISWDLSVVPGDETFRHFPSEIMYRAALPKTKVVAPNLSCTYSGTVTVRGKTFKFDGAPGHQAHIWGTKHAARWAWANCNAFDGLGRGTVLEALTAQIKLGRGMSPPLSVACLKLDGREYAFNGLRNMFSTVTEYDVRRWELAAEGGGHLLKVHVACDPVHMVGVNYRDPDGEGRVCHNTKVADARVELFERKTGGGLELVRELRSSGTCAFEVVEPHAVPGVRVMI
jgi:hypothetical protein